MEQTILKVGRPVWRKFLALTVMVSLFTSFAQPLDFSIKGPNTNGWGPADIIAPLGDNLVIPAADLGLPPGADVNSFSYGTDEVEPLGPLNWVHLAYSVTRDSDGVGGAVFVEAMPAGNGVGGDTFHVTYVRAEVGTTVLFFSTPPRRLLDATLRKLMPRDPGPETELDGLSLNLGSAYPIYFTVEGTNAADIFVVTNRGGPPQVFARAAELGLLPSDNIDALAIRGIGGAPPSALENGVVVWVSLRGRAPAVGGPVDAVYQVFPGPPALAVPGARLDVAFGDEIDAIAGLDPGPEPFLIPSVVPREGINLLLVGETESSYTIQTTKSLAAPSWTDWKTKVTIGGSRRVELFDTISSSATFYRARREPL